MKKLFLSLCMVLLSAFAFAQVTTTDERGSTSGTGTNNAKVRSDEMSQPEIDNLSGAKPDGDDLSPQNGVTSYSTDGDDPLVMDKPEDDESFDPVKGNPGSLIMADLTTATVYPNPATDYIVVNSEATVGYIRILNLLGQEMMVVDISSEESYVNITDLDEGIYFVSIESGDQKIVKKIKVLK